MNRERSPFVFDEVDAVQNRMVQQIGATLQVATDRTNFQYGWHKSMS
jgi:hypothetical protein